MEIVDFKQAKEWNGPCGSLSAMGCRKLRMPASFCRQDQKMSRGCGSYGSNFALAFLLRQAGCSLSVDTNSSHIIYCGLFASFGAALPRLVVA